MTTDWDVRFLTLAALVATWSKDPSTKVGALIVRPDRTISSLGYNGLPRGIADTPDRLNDRPQRILQVVHAEANAIVTAREPLTGHSMYVWPCPSCATCAGLIIQSGITRVITIEPDKALLERWAESFQTTIQMLREARVDYTQFPRTSKEPTDVNDS